MNENLIFQTKFCIALALFLTYFYFKKIYFKRFYNCINSHQLKYAEAKYYQMLPNTVINIKTNVFYVIVCLLQNSLKKKQKHKVEKHRPKIKHLFVCHIGIHSIHFNHPIGNRIYKNVWSRRPKSQTTTQPISRPHLT